MANIIIINKDNNICEFFKVVFEDHNYETLYSKDVIGLDSLLSINKPNILFIDYETLCSNNDLIQKVKLDSNVFIYIIACGKNKFGVKDVEKSFDCNADDFLNIPCPPVVALTRVNVALIRYKIFKENVKIRKELYYKENLLKDLLNNIPDIIYFKDRKGKLILVNKAHASGLGKNINEIIGKTDFDLFPVSEAEKMTIDDTYVMETGKPIIDKIEFTTRPNGERHYVSTTKIPRFDEEGNVIGLMGITRIITKRILAEKAAMRERKLLNGIINSLNIPVYVLDKDANIIFWNKACEKLSNIRKRDVLKTKKFKEIFRGENECCLSEKLLHFSGDYEEIEKMGIKNLKKISENPLCYMYEEWVENDFLKRKAYLRRTVCLLKDERDSVYGVVESFEDLTEHKLIEDDLEKSKRMLSELALRDSLTGLYNYRFFSEFFLKEFQRSRRSSCFLSIVLIDIDFFKAINDTYGHQVGDEILKQFAEFLLSICRKNDTPIRFGGEEFMILLTDTDKLGLKNFLDRLFNELRKKIFICDADHSIELKISAGGASIPDFTINNEKDFLRAADRSLMKAKELGGGRYEIYECKRMEDILKKKEIENFSVVKEKVYSMQKRMERSAIEFLYAYAKSMEGKPYFEKEHIEKVKGLVEKIALILGIDEVSLDHLKNASVLYDIGKSCIDENILNKKGKLTRAEFEKIKVHPKIAVEILKDIELFKGAIPSILYHHERYDGKGYNSRLKGKQIPLGARILAVADAYQALVSDRPYRKAYSKLDALQLIKKESGKHFDPEVVTALEKALLN